jgi:sirohydrochlorin ferrochelatase
MNKFRPFSLLLILSGISLAACFWAFRLPVGSASPLQRQQTIKLNADGLHSWSKTAIILVDHGSKRKEANQHVEQIVDKIRRKGQYPIVEPAHMEMVEPSISTAFRKCVEQGATHVICHPFFLARGKHVQEDIPQLISEAAKEFPSTSFKIAEPLGLHEGLVGLVEAAIESSLP